MIIWVSSYPKSGNTLVRSIISTLIYSKDGICNFDFLENIDQYPQNYHFEGLTKKLNNINELSKFWTISQDKLNLDKKIKFLKTHHLRCEIGNYTFTNSKNTIGTIYIVRDPRDVITSYAKHFSLTIENAKECIFSSKNFACPVDVENENERLITLFGSWSGHYNAWTKNNKNLLLIKYENLISNKKLELLRILKFLHNFIKIPTDQTIINNCINSTSFENMKKMEEQGYFKENNFDQKTGKKIKFFDKGKKNEWKNVLNPKIRVEIEEKFQKEMKELGYI